jgi:hypothetical protein
MPVRSRSNKGAPGVLPDYSSNGEPESRRCGRWPQWAACRTPTSLRGLIEIFARCPPYLQLARPS